MPVRVSWMTIKSHNARHTASRLGDRRTRSRLYVRSKKRKTLSISKTVQLQQSITTIDEEKIVLKLMGDDDHNDTQAPRIKYSRPTNYQDQSKDKRPQA